MTLINILTRTSNRPNYFKTCCNSIKQQTYKKINHIICTDDSKSLPYIKEYTNNYIQINPEKYKHDKYKKFSYHNNQDIGDSPAWWNSYFNDMYPLLKDGWVIYLDDDDQFTYENSLEYMLSLLPNENSLLFWKVQFPGYTIPRINSPSLITNKPINGNISGIGFMFHTNYIKNASWEAWGGGDYRVSIKLWDVIPNKIETNEILTKLQHTPHLGNRQDKPSHS